MTGPELSVHFFLQMFCILVACRVVGAMARWIGQPQVVGEMIAGVVLGPSVLGVALPGVQQWLFPPESLKVLYVGAQLGVGLYMFLVGVEFSTSDFMARARSAASVAIAGMVAPFVLGALLAAGLLKLPGLFSPKASAAEAMLFLGSALSITAFPMLARILYERGLTGTALGTLALSAGAIGDAVAWCVMAVVLASFGDNPAVAAKAVIGGIVYGAVALTLGRRWLARLGTACEREGRLTPNLLSITLVLFMAAVWFTDYIGVHAVFGGFLLGVAMPRGRLARELKAQLEPFALIVLLPMFFTYSGLNTHLEMVANGRMLLIALLVMAAACLGKAGACWAAARWHGEDNRTALAVGTLMNARGLMELIIINIGLQRGLIEEPLFAVLVLMAIATTLLAAPTFEWVYGRHVRREKEANAGAQPLPGSAWGED